MVAVAAGLFDSVAPRGDRVQFRRALRQARHSLTDWDAARE
ncbi:hypothetical protein [Nocardia africana]